MPMPEETMRRYVVETASIDLGDGRPARLAIACDAVSATLQVVAADSLFDTEPDQLQLALDESAVQARK